LADDAAPAPGHLFDEFPEDEELRRRAHENEQAMEMTKIASDILSASVHAYASTFQQPERRHEDPGRGHHHPQHPNDG
jgi:hypothetical protein